MSRDEVGKLPTLAESLLDLFDFTWKHSTDKQKRRTAQLYENLYEGSVIEWKECDFCDEVGAFDSRRNKWLCAYHHDPYIYG